MSRHRIRAVLIAATVVAGGGSLSAAAEGRVSGELRKWHRVTITFDGPATSEDARPNPFRDYRLDVTFTRGSKKYVVCGYYAADGDAANTSAAKGGKWRVHFAPDEVGEWHYRARFRAGADVALRDEAAAGKPAAFDGAAGSFRIGPTDKTGRDHRAKGRLRYVGKHYLQFAETREYFIKGGADSPENFLGYFEFDDTHRAGQAGGRRRGEARAARLHRYQPHVRDWRPGDPTWKPNRGKGILGALNYLASEGMNSVYMLTMNVGGDGKDVWPWTSEKERFRFDCSKLDQWEVVFGHMDRLGLALHVITQETENDQLLDGGRLGPQRKLYYRELIARFGHHLAVVWNLGEENTNTDAQRKAFCRYIRRLDPYGHPIVVHTFPGRYDPVYRPLLGEKCFEGPSLQIGNMRSTHRETMKWIDESIRARRRWFVCLDEIGPANTGVKPDRDDPTHDDVRRYALWGNLMAGGAGAEWYMGYKYAHNDLNCEDWRSRDRMWDQTRFALEFFQRHLPFVEMRHNDELTAAADDYCLAKPGRVYAVYLARARATKLDLGKCEDAFTVRWYNPRAGGGLLAGSVAEIRGPGAVSLGTPPAQPDKDWVALVARKDGKLAGPADPKAAGRTIDDPGLDWPAGKRPRKGSAGPGDGPERSAGSVKSFTLINADTDKPIAGFDPLQDGAVLNLAALPTRNLNIRANTDPPQVGSVRFGLDGRRNSQTESTAPYALEGDTQGNYAAWTPSLGAHKLTATPFSRSRGGGKRGKALTVTFRVIDKR